MQGPERVRALYQSEDPNPWKEEEDKTVEDEKDRAGHANRKALSLLLKPSSPTPSNTWSLRSFQRDTERGKWTQRHVLLLLLLLFMLVKKSLLMAVHN